MYILKTYSDFIKLTPEEFINEADFEEDNNVKLRNRKIKGYLLDFKTYLKTDKKYSPQNISKMMTIVRSFYREFSIEIPYIIIRKNIEPRQTYNDIPTIDHVRKVLEICNRKYKAIITLMLSSGLGAGEILDLTYQDFINAIYEYVEIALNDVVDVELLRTKLIKEDSLIIGTWKVTRKKTQYNYTTFSSPESINYILDYLVQSPPIDLESNLFRTARNQNIPLEYNAFKNYFARLNDELDLGKFGRQRFFHSHVLRKIFTNILHKQKISKLRIDWYLGHRINDVDEAYFKADLQDLKNEYIKCIPDLSIENIETHILESPEYQELKKLQIDSKAKDGEMNELKEQVEYLTTIVEMITDPKTNKTPKFMKGREDVLEYVEKNKDKILKNE
jgi:integrase